MRWGFGMDPSPDHAQRGRTKLKHHQSAWTAAGTLTYDTSRTTFDDSNSIASRRVSRTSIASTLAGRYRRRNDPGVVRRPRVERARQDRDDPAAEVRGEGRAGR